MLPIRYSFTSYLTLYIVLYIVFYLYFSDCQSCCPPIRSQAWIRLPGQWPGRHERQWSLLHTPVHWPSHDDHQPAQHVPASLPLPCPPGRARPSTGGPPSLCTTSLLAGVDHLTRPANCKAVCRWATAPVYSKSSSRVDHLARPANCKVVCRWATVPVYSLLPGIDHLAKPANCERLSAGSSSFVWKVTLLSLPHTRLACLVWYWGE